MAGASGQSRRIRDCGPRHRVSADTVADLLREEGFSLQVNAKTLEGGQHPDWDAPIRYINDRAKEHMGAVGPVISVETKKKELVGPYKIPPHSAAPSTSPRAQHSGWTVEAPPCTGQ